MSRIKKALQKLDWFLISQLGMDLRKLSSSIVRLGPYLADLRQFKSAFPGQIVCTPCIHDKHAESGDIRNEYFWQDLEVARMIHAAMPDSHVDIGSRVDGFVAHVAAFRNIEVVDIRENKTVVPGVTFVTLDFSNTDRVEEFIAAYPDGYCDSVSCLHALEHFGLGRYGDTLDPEGYQKGLKNLALVLSAGGTLYLSTPVGRERVEFNAHWVFSPGTIIDVAAKNGLVLSQLYQFRNDSGAKKLAINEETIAGLSASDYSLCLFVFRKE